MEMRNLHLQKKDLAILFVLLLSMAGVTKVYAYSFSAVCPSGQTLYYNITDATNHYVEVTYPTWGWGIYTRPSGNLVIPDLVEYNNTMYSVTNIGEYAFDDCIGLTSVSFPNTLISIGGYGAFHECTGLTSLSFPNSLTMIGNSVFEFCSNLTSVTLPNSLITIDDCAFNQCDLTSVVIPNSVTSIGNCAFYRLYNLTSVTIGSSVSWIGNDAFRYCTDLTSLTILAEDPPGLGTRPFEYVPMGIPVYVPCGSIEAYQSAQYWSDFLNYYELNCPFSNTPIGAIHSVFSVSDNTAVCFSQGNLQYQASTNTWRFAENQWDYMDFFNEDISSVNTGWIDLFGYGTSGYNHGATCYQPWSDYTEGNAYYAYNLFDQTGQADWGYNPISNGGDIENMGWYTLTKDEWNYIFNTRNTASGIRYAKAKVSNVNGVILLPDDWIVTTYSLNNTNSGEASFNSNVISAELWTILETAGAVFLPAAGRRWALTPNGCGSYGYYWSASIGSNNLSYFMYFRDGYLSTSSQITRSYGLSVRLVYPVDVVRYGINASPSPAEGGTVSGAGIYMEGTECTLTVMANSGYTFLNWTENGEVVSTDSEYTFTVTRERNIVANFILNSYDITATASTTWGGSVAVANQVTNSWTGGQSTYRDGYVSIDWQGTPSGNVDICIVYLDIDDGIRERFYFSWWASDGLFHFDGETYSFGESIDTWIEAEDYPDEADVSSTFSDGIWTIYFEGNNDYNNLYCFVTVLNDGNCDATEYIEGGEYQYNYGQTCTLAAMANEGFTFTNWTENDIIVSTESEYSFMVNDDRSLVAHFELSEGYLTFDGLLYHITNTNPNEVEVIGHLEGTALQGSIEIPESVTSEGINYAVTSIASEAFSGYTGLTSVTIGNSITSIGTSAFNGCSELASVTVGNSVSFIGIDAFKDCNSLTTVNHAGTIASWCGISFGNSDSNPLIQSHNLYLNGSLVTDLVIPDGVTSIGNHAFRGCSGITSVTIGNSVTSIGAFAFSGCSGITSVTIGNSVTSIGTSAFLGCSGLTYVTIGNSVTSIGSFAFRGCSGLTSVAVLAETPPSVVSNTFYGVSASIPVYVPCGSKSAYQVASYWNSFTNYIEICPYTVFASANPIEGGTITGTGMYDEGSVVSLTATPAEGYTFVNWTENDEEVSTDATYSFTVTSDRTLVANFSEIPPDNHWTSITGTQYNLTMSGVISIDGIAQTSTAFEVGAFCGDECRGSARAQYFPPSNEYVVSLAVVSNQQSGETIIFRLYDHDTQQEFPSECVNSITFVANANFGEMGNWYPFAFNNSVAVTATVTPEGAGTVEGAGDYLLGTSCTLTATANTGYTFVNWTENGEVVSTNNPYTFMVNGAVELTANFSLNSYSITASSNPTTGGTIDGTGTYYHFSSCTLTATANTGYVFRSWSVAGEVVSTDNPYTFTVNSAAELTANFSLISYDITATSNPTTGGIIDGTGTYEHFSSCTLTAMANTGYAFRFWSVNGETVSTDNPYTFSVSGAVELTANFDAQETTTLDNGWTWWSTSIEMSGIDGLTMLEESLGHNGLTIKSANKFVQNYYPNTGYDYWFGQLTSDDFNNESSYMIQTSTSCEVMMTGMYANPSDHPIQLYPNWTWIGYPCGIQQSAASAFAGFTPTHNDLLKGQYAFSTYYDNYGWFPEFSLTPGQGYMYQSLASGNRTLTFANGSKADPVPTNGEDRYWRNNVHAYADNMNVIAVVTVSGEEQHGEDIELGAFVNGECRGSAMLKHFQPTDRWYAMLTVTGADGDEIEFGIIDRNRGMASMTSNRSLVFQTNTVVGELDEPYVIDFGTLGCIENGIEEPMHIYPNPIERNTRFTIALPETETLSDIFIVNMMGEVVAHETNKDKMTALQTPGVYTVKVVCHSGKVFVGKLVVR